jgi:hypothetical protein
MKLETASYSIINGDISRLISLLYFCPGLRNMSFITEILTLLENISYNALWYFIYLLYALSFICINYRLIVRYFVQYYKYL